MLALLFVLLHMSAQAQPPVICNGTMTVTAENIKQCAKSAEETSKAAQKLNELTAQAADWGSKANGSCLITDKLLAQSLERTEPIDVPAVQVKCWCGGPNQNDINGDVPRCGAERDYPKKPNDLHGSCVGVPRDYYKCKDTKRILMKAENGDAWCHRVQP